MEEGSTKYDRQGVGNQTIENLNDHLQLLDDTIGAFDENTKRKFAQIKKVEKELTSILEARSESNDPLLLSAAYCLARLALDRKDYTLAKLFCSRAVNGFRKALEPRREEYHHTIILLNVISLGLGEGETQNSPNSLVDFGRLSLPERFICCSKEIECLRFYGYNERAGQVGCDFLRQNYVAKLPWPWEPGVEGRDLNWRQLQLNIENVGFAGKSAGFGPIHYLSIAGPEAHQEIDYILQQGAEVDAFWTMPGRSETVVWQDCTPLISASGCGNLQVCLTLLSHGANVSAMSYRRRTALFLAAAYGRLDLIEELLRRGVDINLRDKIGDTPLSLACFQGGLEAVKLLANRGAKYDTTDDEGTTLMHLAAESNNDEVLDFLRSKGMDIEVEDSSQQRPTHRAATMDSVKALTYLLDNGAEIDALDCRGETPLHGAVFFGSNDCLRLLLFRDAKINVLSLEGNSPLLLAIANEQVESIKLLLAAGVDINCRNLRGESPLHFAAADGSLSVLELLIRRGADVQAQCIDGSSPLHMACSQNKMDIMSALIASGANINATDGAGLTCLDRAAIDGQVETARFLMQNNAIKVSSDYPAEGSWTVLDGAVLANSLPVVELLITEYLPECMAWITHHQPNASAIHLACRKGNIEILRSLLGIVPTNLVNEDRIPLGLTALHISAFCGSDGCTQLLIENGASLQSEDLDMNTPLHVACLGGHKPGIKILVDAARSSGNLPSLINRLNKHGSTPLLLAIDGGHYNCISPLLEAGAFIPEKSENSRPGRNSLDRYGSMKPTFIETLQDHSEKLKILPQGETDVVKRLVKRSRSWVEPLMLKRQKVFQPSTTIENACDADPLWICCSVRTNGDDVVGRQEISETNTEA